MKLFLVKFLKTLDNIIQLSYICITFKQKIYYMKAILLTFASNRAIEQSSNRAIDSPI